MDQSVIDATKSRMSSVLNHLDKAIDKIPEATRQIETLYEITPPNTAECFRVAVATDKTLWMWWPITRKWLKMELPNLPQLPTEKEDVK